MTLSFPSLFDPLLVVVLLINFFLLGTSRVRATISASALQGVVLGLLAATAHGELSVEVVLVSLGAVGIKGILIPRLLYRAMRDVVIHKEVEPLIGFTTSLMLGAVGTGLAVIFAQTLPLAPGQPETLLLPCSFSTVFTGFLVLTTRRKAITQVVGYLVLENGIFVLGLALLQAMPSLVELGVLLDLFVAIFVMGIIINHISREFGTLDVARLRALKE